MPTQRRVKRMLGSFLFVLKDVSKLLDFCDSMVHRVTKLTGYDTLSAGGVINGFEKDRKSDF